MLHSFGEGEDGFQPYGGLIIDASGNLYGTTTFVGVYSNKYGTVFALTPKAGGGWTGKVLHSFDNKGADGIDSQAGVIIDGSGNLYGTIQGGGAYAKGTVFELTPKAGGGWTEQVLHTFNGKDGLEVYGGLVIDGSGNLYGTTTDGGAYEYNGNVFELTPTAGGGWTEKVLHNFSQNGKDGYWPYGA